MESKEFNIITGVLSFIGIAGILFHYFKKNDFYLPNIGDFSGPGLIYFVIAMCSFFTLVGLHSFYLAWKKYRKEKEQKDKK